MTILRIFLLAGWLIMLAMSWRALTELGYNWPDVFFGDIANNTWRARFNIDFLNHLLLFATWVVWRETSRLTGLFSGFSPSSSAACSAFHTCWPRLTGLEPIRAGFRFESTPRRRRSMPVQQPVTGRLK
ncbi:MAG: hypothetical protein PVG76_08330 [Chromatiales bacterium]|jgi:hypothetical protein